VRHAVFGFEGWVDLWHVAFLVAFALISWRLAIRFMERKLILSISPVQNQPVTSIGCHYR
jgi:hypothetical protein